MTKEIITLQLGQCGNQIGLQYWNKIIKEHKINSDENILLTGEEEHSKDQNISSKEYNNTYTSENLKKRLIPVQQDPNVLLEETQDSSFIPRVITIDSEPRVLSKFHSTSSNFNRNRNSSFLCADGVGAGNNWAKGYSIGLSEEGTKILQHISSQLEKCDSPGGFQVLHSISGGTGSGLGSYLLEKMFDYFPKSPIITASVFPSFNDDTFTDLVVHPYNSILTISRLIRYSSVFLPIDNSKICQAAKKNFLFNQEDKSKTFQFVNERVSQLLSSLTFNSRFGPVSGGNGLDPLRELESKLVTLPFCNMVVGGLASNDEFPQIKAQDSFDLKRNTKKSISSLTRKLANFEQIMFPFSKDSDINPGKAHSVVASLIVAEGTMLNPELREEIYRSKSILRDKKEFCFVPWSAGLPCLNINPVERNKCRNFENESGSLLVNHTNPPKVLRKLILDFDKIFKKNAFLFEYKKMEVGFDVISEMQECRNELESFISNYTDTEDVSFIDKLLD